jgi:hypothetical protein
VASVPEIEIREVTMATKTKRSPAQRAATAKLVAMNRGRKRKRKNPSERHITPTVHRGLGFAVLADSSIVVGVFALQGDARTFAQAIADQTEKQLRVVPGAYTFTPDAR